MVTLPRIAIAAPASGHGKTTVATGVMAALSRRGLAVSGHKVGPDYIDPGYHALATGRPGRNLDPHLVGEDLLVPLLLHGAAGADVAVVEGVMGLHDGQIGGDGFASTAHVAKVTRTPVILVVDISHASRSIGAMVQGMAAFDPDVEIAGVILNKAGSTRHANEVRRSIKLPVLGVLHRDDGIVAPSRHLGLVPAEERDEAAATLDRLVEQVSRRIDLDRLTELAQRAGHLDAEPWNPERALAGCPVSSGAPEPSGSVSPRPVIAMAGGRAFTFRYTETEELLRAAGCDVHTFDPLLDQDLPAGTSAIYLGGGFPEVHASALAQNARLRSRIAAAANAGMPIVAECAGLLYLSQSLDQAEMTGVLPAQAQMSPRLTLSYRELGTSEATLLTRPGEVVTGHEFHRTTIEPTSGDRPAWTIGGDPIGFAGPTLHASYVHTHWAGHPQLAARFAEAARTHTTAKPSPEPQPATAHTERGLHIAASPHDGIPKVPAAAPVPQLDDTPKDDPLRHHGDVEAGADLIDFAVNVFDGPRPDWLEAALHRSLDDIGQYPSATRAEHAIARHHGRTPDSVLATAGAAEAFSLIARSRRWQHPLVVHPQFTEPDVALAEAGHRPEHLHCRAEEGFTLDPDRVPAEADLVIIGNPTNPTGVLHPASSIRRLLRPGRIVVVDEAFLDAVPGEAESLATAPVPGLVVIRSLTKLWSIPGVRAGYLLAPPEEVRRLRSGQVPWSVGTTAAAAMIACSDEIADAEADTRIRAIAARRRVLTEGLTELGIEHITSSAPFVLVRPGQGIRETLRAAGFAVRRADTFPGLDASWIRIAVRRPDLTRQLLAALAALPQSGPVSA